MTNSKPRGATLLAAICCVAAASALHPAVAAPTFSGSGLLAYRDAAMLAGTCSSRLIAPELPPHRRVLSDGVPVRSRVQNAVVFTAPSFSDTLSLQTDIDATSRIRTLPQHERQVSMSFSGSSSALSALSQSSCRARIRSRLTHEFELTLDGRYWATVRTQTTGPVRTLASVSSQGAPFFELRTGHLSASGSTSYLLEPGGYSGIVEADVELETSAAVPSRTSRGTLSLTFARVGSASARPSGKAKPYVTLPTARACASHDVKAAITGSAKRAKRIDSVVYKVNGRKVATLKGKKVKKRKATSLRIADNRAAQVEAIVTLNSGKRLSTKASYLACRA